MVRHTLSSLGPKVLATRMVRDYVQRLYAPAAAVGRALQRPTYVGASELAAWKHRVRDGLAAVRVDHVESSRGQRLAAARRRAARCGRSSTSAGSTPDDVEVQVVHGRVATPTTICRPDGRRRWRHAESLRGRPAPVRGRPPADRTGPFGYTVRVLPRHTGLASPAELGLVATA